MRIASVSIRNFRALKNVEIEFDAVTTFIGPNGVGKSTVLHALDWFFNGKPGGLADSDFCFGSTEKDIEVRISFCDLTQADRHALGKYAPEGVTTFTAWKRRSHDGLEVLSANAKSYPLFNEIRASASASLKKERYALLRNTRSDLGLPLATTGLAVDHELTSWESSNIDLLEDAPENLQTNFFGFNGNGKMAGLFDFVLVTADLRAGEEAVDGKSSIVGRILERSVDRTVVDQEISQIVDEARLRQQQAYESGFKGQLSILNQKLNAIVSTYSPGREIQLAPGEITLKAVRTTFDVSVIDGPAETAVERQGHGFQRTLLISALQLLAQSSAVESDGVICLAIEEPELYQHPIQAQTFAKILRALSEDSSKRIQVVYATHSPYFLEARHFNQIRRLTRSSDGEQDVTVHATGNEAVRNSLRGVLSPDAVDRKLDSFVGSELAIALFANRALIVEGATEAAVFYGIGDRSGVGSLEALGISVVAAGGKTMIPLANSILSLMGIPTYSLFDADSGFEVRAVANGKTRDKIDQERETHASANRLVLRNFRLEEVDFPDEAILDDVAILSDRLEESLSESWPEWSDACREIEVNAGISLQKNQHLYREVTLKASGEVPEHLRKILQRAGSS